MSALLSVKASKVILSSISLHVLHHLYFIMLFLEVDLVMLLVSAESGIDVSY